MLFAAKQNIPLGSALRNS